MRIAVLTNAYPPKQTGGAARIAEAQVEMLRAAGHEVRVWCPVTRWLSHSFPARLFGHLMDFFPHDSIKNDILVWKPEILITHNLMGCGFTTARVIQKTGVRWVHVLHDIQLFEPLGQSTDVDSITVKQKLLGGVRRRVFGTPNLIISPTQWLLDQHLRRRFFQDSSTQQIVLPNPTSSIGIFVRISRSVTQLLFVGALTRAKGSEFLIKLAQAMPSLELLIVGSGLEERMMRAALPQAKFYGILDTNQVLEKMKEVDVLLVPSTIEENQPTVILEAASVGLPVIASNKAGIVETLGEAGKALPLNVDEWKTEIDRLAHDQQYYAVAVRQMQELAKQHDPDAYAQRLISLLKSNT